jgi:CheY-like chemotaxis protein
VEKHLDILIVHDDLVEAERLLQELAKQNVPCHSRCVREAELVQALEQHLPDLVLFDSCHGCCESRGLAALDLAHHRWPNLPFVFVCGSCDPKVELEVVASGAAACVYRGHLSDVAPAIEQALEAQRQTSLPELQAAEDFPLFPTAPAAVALEEQVGTLPFCVRCRRVQTPVGLWRDLCDYFDHHDRATLARSLCPSCQRSQRWPMTKVE